MAEITTFKDLKCLDKWIIDQLNQLNIKQPTPVQVGCIPEALKERDIIGSAKTGSGKTLAFVIPILQKLAIDPYGIYALVLTPTRELAFQIGDQFKAVGSPMRINVSVVTGGFNKVDQGRELSRSPHILIATPGRLTDILNTSPEFTLKRIKFLVLDEADRLMDGRFDKQLKPIWEALPPKRQTLMFSATITDRLQQMKEMASSDLFHWEITDTQATVLNLEEKYTLLNPLVKDASLVSLLMNYQENNPKSLVIIFTETCKNAQVLCMMLNEFSIKCLCLHSMMKQKDRLDALSKFKSSQVKILIATDLASRGLDIPLVELVVNHCIPNIPKNYVHRVGRTARAGKGGSAITFVIAEEIKLLFAIESFTRRKLTEFQIDERHMKSILREVNITKKEQEIKLEESGFDERRLIIKEKQERMRQWEEDSDEDEEESLPKKKKEKKRHSSPGTKSTKKSSIKKKKEK